jgi:hypothetical protein
LAMATRFATESYVGLSLMLQIKMDTFIDLNPSVNPQRKELLVAFLDSLTLYRLNVYLMNAIFWTEYKGHCYGPVKVFYDSINDYTHYSQMNTSAIKKRGMRSPILRFYHQGWCSICCLFFKHVCHHIKLYKRSLL